MGPVRPEDPEIDPNSAAPTPNLGSVLRCSRPGLNHPDWSHPSRDQLLRRHAPPRLPLPASPSFELLERSLRTIAALKLSSRARVKVPARSPRSLRFWGGAFAFLIRSSSSLFLSARATSKDLNLVTFAPAWSKSSGGKSSRIPASPAEDFRTSIPSSTVVIVRTSRTPRPQLTTHRDLFGLTLGTGRSVPASESLGRTVTVPRPCRRPSPSQSCRPAASLLSFSPSEIANPAVGSGVVTESHPV